MTDAKPNFKVFIWILVWLVITFVWFIAINEFTLQTGEDVYFQTVPVDPRDILRWDYVILSYDFEQDEILRNFVTQNNTQAWDILYLSFDLDSDKLATLSSVTDTKPSEWVFLQVKKRDSTWRVSSIETWIWKYFVPQWTGREIERIRWDMLVHTKVDTSGKAQIVDLYYKGEKIDPKTFVYQ